MVTVFVDAGRLWPKCKLTESGEKEPKMLVRAAVAAVLLQFVFINYDFVECLRAHRLVWCCALTAHSYDFLT
jgi:hypothetical protein